LVLFSPRRGAARRTSEVVDAKTLGTSNQVVEATSLVRSEQRSDRHGRSREAEGPETIHASRSTHHNTPAAPAKEFEMPQKTIDMNPVDSSQIHSIGHDAESNTLAIRFKNYKGDLGSLYHYDNFTADDFAAFKGADSLGSHFGKHIKTAVEKFPFRKIDATPSATESV
jgi:hypothetical protein